MTSEKKIKIVYSKPPDTPDSKKKELTYQAIVDYYLEHGPVRIGDIATCLNKKYAPAIEFCLPDVARYIFEMEDMEDGICYDTKTIDGHLYYVVLPSKYKAGKRD